MAIGALFRQPEALKGVRVLDLTRIIYGPWCTTLLAEMGAEVIRVELPGTGDLLGRAVAYRGLFPRNIPCATLASNANKYFVAIDMHKPEGLELIKKLVARCDVLVENFKPGTFDRWGIGYRQLTEIRPDLIYASLQGFGNWGGLSGRPSYDAFAQGISGLAEITGFPDAIPIKAQAWIGDFLSGTVAAFAILVALHHRNRTGKGQFIDLGQAEVLVRCMDWTWPYLGLTGKNRERFGNRDMAVVPSCIVRCEDGFAAVAAFTEEEFTGVCRAMGREDLLRYRDLTTRAAGADEIYRAVEEWVQGRTVADLLRDGEQYGFPAVRVMNARDIYESRHFNERRAVWKFEDPLLGDLCYPFCLHLEETPGRIKWSIRPVGFDNEYVFRKLLGLSAEELERLYAEKVVGKWDEKLVFTVPPADWDGRRGLFWEE